MNKRRHKIEDYQTVTRSRKEKPAQPSAVSDAFNSKPVASIKPSATPSTAVLDAVIDPRTTLLKRGHAFSFALLFLFTLVLYARPAEFYPSAATRSLALIIGVITLAMFVVTQLTIDGRLTARPTEVNLAILFLLTALASIPLAIDPVIAWGEFTNSFVRAILIFIVVVNVVRTPSRLKWMLALSVLTALVLSLQTMNSTLR